MDLIIIISIVFVVVVGIKSSSGKEELKRRLWLVHCTHTECQVNAAAAEVVEYAENAAGGVVARPFIPSSTGCLAQSLLIVIIWPCVYVDYTTCTCRQTTTTTKDGQGRAGTGTEYRHTNCSSLNEDDGRGFSVCWWRQSSSADECEGIKCGRRWRWRWRDEGGGRKRRRRRSLSADSDLSALN